MDALSVRSTHPRRPCVCGPFSVLGVLCRWGPRKLSRHGDERVCLSVGVGVGVVVRGGEQADGQRGCDVGKELWGGVAGVGKEGALPIGSRCMVNGFRSIPGKADGVEECKPACRALVRSQEIVIKFNFPTIGRCAQDHHTIVKFKHDVFQYYYRC